MRSPSCVLRSFNLYSNSRTQAQVTYGGIAARARRRRRRRRLHGRRRPPAGHGEGAHAGVRRLPVRAALRHPHVARRGPPGALQGHDHAPRRDVRRLRPLLQRLRARQAPPGLRGRAVRARGGAGRRVLGAVHDAGPGAAGAAQVPHAEGDGARHRARGLWRTLGVGRPRRALAGLLRDARARRRGFGGLLRDLRLDEARARAVAGLSRRRRPRVLPRRLRRGRRRGRHELGLSDGVPPFFSEIRPPGMR